jgi:hypothetical protein
MKKFLTVLLVALMVLAITLPAFANPVKVDKKAFDAFPAQKLTANNKVTGIGNFELVSDSKAGWRLISNNAEIKGSIDVAYKIGSDYFVVTFKVDGKSSHYIGDGSGKNGVNMAKVGEFFPVASVGFIGWYVYAGTNSVGQTSIYWQDLYKGDKINWDAVEAAYGAWVDEGGLPLPNPTKGWQSSGVNSFYREEARPELGYADFSEGQREVYYEAYYLDPGYDDPFAAGDEDKNVDLAELNLPRDDNGKIVIPNANQGTNWVTIGILECNFGSNNDAGSIVFDPSFFVEYESVTIVFKQGGSDHHATFTEGNVDVVTEGNEGKIEFISDEDYEGDAYIIDGKSSSAELVGLVRK